MKFVVNFVMRRVCCVREVPVCCLKAKVSKLSIRTIKPFGKLFLSRVDHSVLLR